MERVVDIVSWIHRAGPDGALIFAALAVIAILAMVPASVIATVAGFAFGVVAGAAIALGVIVLGSVLSFVGARTVAGRWLARRAAAHPRMARIRHALVRRGFRVVLLVRLSPVIPHAPTSYVLGPMGVRLRDFVLGTALGAIPVAVLGAYVGSMVPSAARLARGELPVPNGVHAIAWSIGLVATVLAAIVASRLARRALDVECDLGSRSVSDRDSHPVGLS